DAEAERRRHHQHLHRLGLRAERDVPDLRRVPRRPRRLHQGLRRHLRRRQRPHEQRPARLDRQPARDRRAPRQRAAEALRHQPGDRRRHRLPRLRRRRLHHRPEHPRRRRDNALDLSRRRMERPAFYCKSWFRAKKRPTELWPESAARAAHDARTLYTVLIDSIEAPFCFIEIARNFVGIGFLDERVRERRYVSFRETAPGVLFLDSRTSRDFVGDSDVVSMGTTCVFRPKGSLSTIAEHFHPHRVETTESTTDVSNNYAG